MIARTPSPLRRRSGPSLRRRRQAGLSLIEILVSVVILGIGLLGVAAMQSLALRGGQSSLEASQAVMQTNAIIEAMRANRLNADDYATVGMVCAVPTGGTLAQNDIANWISSLKTSIAGVTTDTSTCGQITGCPLNCVITVQWDDTRAGGGATRSFTTRTTI